MTPGNTVLTAILTTAALAGSALAAPAAVAARGRATSPAFTNPGAASPSLSLSVSPSGEPEVASVGPNGTLWFAFSKGGNWHRTRVGGPGSACSGPSLFAGPAGVAGIAVEGAAHTLQFYARAAGRWHHFVVAGAGSAFSAPSLAVGMSKAGIAVEGPRHSLVFYSGGFSGTSVHLHKKIVNGSGTTYSAPSAVIRLPDQATSGHPAGEVDIAVENANHALSYYKSLANGHWQNHVIGGPGSAFSAPSLIVVTTTFAFFGESYLVVEGPHHSLTEFNDHRGWNSSTILGSGRVFSAPSLTLGDLDRQAGIAFRGPSSSVSFLYFSTFSNGWVNDVITAATGTVDSAPALFFRTANPAGEDDLVFQGTGNTLWYFHAPKPGSANLAPNFTGREIAGHGTTFGG